MNSDPEDIFNEMKQPNIDQVKINTLPQLDLGQNIQEEIYMCICKPFFTFKNEKSYIQHVLRDCKQHAEGIQQEGDLEVAQRQDIIYQCSCRPFNTFKNKYYYLQHVSKQHDRVIQANSTNCYQNRGKIKCGCHDIKHPGYLTRESYYRHVKEYHNSVFQEGSSHTLEGVEIQNIQQKSTTVEEELSISPIFEKQETVKMHDAKKRKELGKKKGAFGKKKKNMQDQTSGKDSSQNIAKVDQPVQSPKETQLNTPQHEPNTLNVVTNRFVFDSKPISNQQLLCVQMTKLEILETLREIGTRYPKKK